MSLLDCTENICLDNEIISNMCIKYFEKYGPFGAIIGFDDDKRKHTRIEYINKDKINTTDILKYPHKWILCVYPGIDINFLKLQNRDKTPIDGWDRKFSPVKKITYGIGRADFINITFKSILDLCENGQL